MILRTDEMDAGSVVPPPDGATKGTALAPSQNLRPTLRRTRASRLALATTLALGATLALSGCGAQQSGAAAIVNDTVISDKDVQSVSEQLNKLAQGGETLRTSDALISLILAPYVLAEAQRAGKTVSAAAARKVIAKVPDPSEATIKFVQMQLAIQQLDQASKTSIVNQLAKAKITVNPRYGAFDAKQIALIPAAPNWIKPTAPAAAK
jgi:hypothetical protein